MQLTTLDNIPGQAWEEMGAPLFSEQVQAVNAAKDLVGGIKAMFGGAVRAYSQEYQRARAAALADLTAQGAAWGAEALLGLRVAYQPFVNDGTVFILSLIHIWPVPWGRGPWCFGGWSR